MGEFTMPSLGADMEAGVLTEWKVKTGDRVKRGDIIAEVETQKGVIEIEVFEDGIIAEIKIQPGEKVPVGTVLAIISGSREERPISATGTRQAEKRGESPLSIQPVEEKEAKPTPAVLTDSEKKPAPAVSLQTGAGTHEKRIKATPLARKIAEEKSIDLSMVQGSGEDGIIIRKDVEQYEDTLKTTTETGTEIITELSNINKTRELPIPEKIKAPGTDTASAMRKAIAAVMSKSNREIPLYYLLTRIDMKNALEWLEGENKKRAMKDRLLQPVLLIKAMAKALVDVPQLNGFWINDSLETSPSINIGMVISLRQGGIVVPAIQDVQNKSLDDIMQQVMDITVRSREGKLRASELSSPTVTLTNLGDRGAEAVFGIVYPPQVAIVGAGKITEMPWAVNGMLDVRPVLTVTLAGDHRATDGHTGSRFLEALNNYLQKPASL